MPTARELLEQADALMRRNRAAGGGDGDIPVLTDRVPPNSLATRGGQDGTAVPPRASADDAPGAPPEVAGPRSADADELALALDRSLAEEPPVLTDVVEEVAVDIMPLPASKPDDDDETWLGADTVDPALHSVTGPTPDTLAVVPPVTLRAMPPAPAEEHPAEPVEADFAAAPTLRAAGSEPTPAPVGSAPEAPAVPEGAPAATVEGEEERWRALAEQVSMQVLQRLDLFVDAGLKAKLAEHLRPIVARAETELVEAINERVGQLVRSYVAEAIEREIAQWREGQR